MRKKNPRNHLSNEKSPYLQQHANNPVDWYPWGNDAFERAKVENKPIFLSIGYSTCHWCHVMERESFEDEDVARLMNDNFVSIKVDREERPDIDSYYMTVCNILTGTGGWPLTIIMSPGKKPFFATTYMPKESKYGRAGLMQLIPKIASAWQNQQSNIIKSTEEISEYMERLTSYSNEKKMAPEIIEQTYHALRDAYDPSAGGFGRAPKFPTPQNISFLLRHFLDAGDDESLEMVEHTLKAMRMGSIYDHIGFGFHRYSTDSHWRLPHFEKMLYDQALLIITYGEAFQVTRENLYRDTALEIIDYVLRDMHSPEGVFYSAEDADSEGQEGRYYLWTEPEIRKALTPAEYDLASKAYNIQHDGNYEDEKSYTPNGFNLLYRSHGDEELASELDISVKVLNRRMREVRDKLLAHRMGKTRPLKDNKVLCDWNGLMIVALSKASRIFGDGRSGIAAKRAADFTLANMRASDGRLYHRYIDGEVTINGFLEDYAFLIWGLIELYQVDFVTYYLKMALELNELCFSLFWDEEHGAFYSTSGDCELPIRKKETHDGAIPSGNSIATHNLIRLARLTGRHALEERASMIFNSIGDQIKKNPLGHINMLGSFRQILSPAPNIVISGARENDTTIKMLRAIRNSRRVDIDTLLLPANDLAEMAKITEFAREFRQIGGGTTAYVCKGHECGRPTTDIEELSRIIETHAEDGKG